MAKILPYSFSHKTLASKNNILPYNRVVNMDFRDLPKTSVDFFHQRDFDYFYDAMRPVLQAGRIFGLIPVLTTDNNREMPIFRVKSLWTWYSLVATGLAEKYKCVNKTVINMIISNQYNINWSQIREIYAILSNLVKKTDIVISPLIILSFSANLYSICKQFFSGFLLQGNITLGDVYFFGSFCFILGRTIAVTISAAQINTHSKELLSVLFYCPVSTLNVEPQWLQNQLAIDEVALTGMKFFSVTRKFMLSVVGTIVTYEVILLQFNSSKKE
ncbi:gustatory receptor for sugar taste 64f-like [Aphidius gifuensis]|uniref:gustatory receptor for sugar taste 64f-like n=1 Tax=Aphidius gifuensis TaxID=684658 RepID=UPI001CDBAC9D|nr:gustatory receptor for sugar taste 64f-like [Aphidius gifuensis]